MRSFSSNKTSNGLWLEFCAVVTSVGQDEKNGRCCINFEAVFHVEQNVKNTVSKRRKKNLWALNSTRWCSEKCSEQGTKDAIWKIFSDFAKDGVSSAECGLCEKDVAPLVARMKNCVEERCKGRITREEKPSATKRKKETNLVLASTRAQTTRY